MNREPIKDWRGRILGYLEQEPNGDRIIRDFYQKKLGIYISNQDITKDVYGKIIGRGDLLMTLLNR